MTSAAPVQLQAAKSLAELISELADDGFEITFSSEKTANALTFTIRRNGSELSRAVSRREIWAGQFDILAFELTRCASRIKEAPEPVE